MTSMGWTDFCRLRRPGHRKSSATQVVGLRYRDAAAMQAGDTRYDREAEAVAAGIAAATVVNACECLEDRLAL